MKRAYLLLLCVLTVLFMYVPCRAQVNLTGGSIISYGPPVGPGPGPSTVVSLLTAPGYAITNVASEDENNWGLWTFCDGEGFCTIDQIPSYPVIQFVPDGSMQVNGQLFGMIGFPGFTATTFNWTLTRNGILTTYGTAAPFGDFQECDFVDSGCIPSPNAISFGFGNTQWQYQGQFTSNAFYPGTYDLQTLIVASGVPIGYVPPDPQPFGPQLLRTISAAKSVALTNRGNAQMVVSNVSATGDFAIAYNYCMNGVKPGTHCNVGITFGPTASGTRTGTLTFVTNAANSPHVVDLIGTGTQVKLSAQSIAFPLQLVGTTSAPKQVNFANIGSTAISINSIGVTGDFVLRTAAVNPCPASGTLSGGMSCNIAVAFRPTAANTRTGSLTINDSDPATPHVVKLSGTGTIVKLSATTLSFPTTLLGYKSTAKQVLVTNVGTTQLSISGIAVSGDFAQTNSCGPSLAAGMTCAISVTFAPTVIGTRTGTITITDNGGGSPQTVALKGTGR